METTKKELQPFLVLLGKAIRERRVSLGISQEELATRAGLHRTYVSDVERGIRNITIGALHILASGLQTNLKDLIHVVEDRLQN